MTDPNITFAGKVAFGYPAGVQQGAQDVESSHQEQPAERRVRHGVDPSFSDGIVQRRNGRTQAETDENA